MASSGTNFHSLSEQELVDSLAAFVPPLTVERVQTALRSHDESIDWVEREMREALDE